MRRATEILSNAVRWLPNKINGYKQSSQGVIVPVLRVTENLNGNQTKKLKAQLEKIKNAKQVQAIALLVDNCDGSAAQAHIIIQLLKGQAKKRGVPFITFGQDLCVATGFLLLTAGDKAYVDKTSLVGTTSFGANKVTTSQDLIERVIYNSPGHSYLEAEINSWKPLNEDKRSQILEVSKEIENEIQQQIKGYRGDRLKEPKFQLMSADQALTAGLVDGIGTFQATIEKEYPTAKVRYVSDTPSFFERLKLLRKMAQPAE